MPISHGDKKIDKVFVEMLETKCREIDPKGYLILQHDMVNREVSIKVCPGNRRKKPIEIRRSPVVLHNRIFLENVPVEKIVDEIIDEIKTKLKPKKGNNS
jgi:hypothetical protein